MPTVPLAEGSDPPRARARWRAALSGLVPVIAGLGVGFVVGALFLGDDPEAEAPIQEAGPTEPSRISPAPEPTPSPSYRPLPASAPSRVVVPAIGVDAPVVPVQNGADRVLEIPEDPDVLGWWDVSARPGATTGQTLITGHSVHDGDGALDRVRELRKGQTIDVLTAEGRMRYRITHVRVYDRETLADQADQLFGQDVAKGRLVLVTCTDWNGEYWVNNVIAFGLPLGEPVTRDQ